MAGKKLTEKQCKFVHEYLVDMNASAAAERAGYSPKTAYSIGWTLLKNVEIQNALQIARQELSAKTGITPEKVIHGFGHGAFYDPAEFYDENMFLKSIHDIPKEQRMAITGIEVEELFEGRGEDREHIGRVRKVKFCSRHQNLDSLAKHFGLYNGDKSGLEGFRVSLVMELPREDE